jgi:hypothetical protein
MKDNWARLLTYVIGLVNQELLLQNEYLAAENRIVPTIPLRKIRGRTKWLIESDYAANNLPMNFAWAMGSLLASHLTLPFLTMSIASIPRKVRHAVGSEP